MNYNENVYNCNLDNTIRNIVQLGSSSGDNCTYDNCKTTSDCGDNEQCIRSTCYYVNGKCDKDTDCGDHGGVCMSNKCYCANGWTGENCKNPPCSKDSDCGEHGSCEGCKCVCKDGWTGDKCQIDPCTDVDCGEHGTCEEGTSKCVCKDGWTGDKCQIDPCTLCKEDEVCKEGKCEVDLCKNVDCGEHGTCEEGTGKCVCKDGWIGDRCSIQDKSQSINYIHILLYVLGSIFGVIAVGLGVYLYTRNKRGGRK